MLILIPCWLFEENLYNLPLSQEGSNESSGQPHFAAFSDSVLATPSVMEDSTDYVSPGVTTASSASTPERQNVAVTRKRLREMTLPNVEAAFDENGSEDINLAFGLKMPRHVNKNTQLRAHEEFYTKTVWKPANLLGPSEDRGDYWYQGRLAFKGVSVTQMTHTTQQTSCVNA